MEWRDAMIADSYTDKDGNEKTSWYKVGRLLINGEKITLFSPILLAGKPINFFKPKEKEQSQGTELTPDEDEFVPF